MALPKYSGWKESDMSWLGDIPSHWEVKALRFIGDPIIGLTYSPSDICNADQGVLVLRSTNIQDGKLVNKNNVYVNTDISEKLTTQLNDILICSRNGSRELIGKCGKVGKDFVGVSFGAFTTVFRSPINDFIYYVLNSKLLEYQSGSFLTTTINQLTVGAFNSFKIPLPPIEEQIQIAKFLDYKTAQIDRLIEKKKALIEKLNEQRIAMITQAVTKGLNPDAPMKDSEVDWLGEVPKHWETRRLKLLAKEPLKYGANEAASLTDRSLPRYIRITDVKEDGSLYEETFRSLENDLAEPYLLQEGDILLARSGATVGKCFQYDESWGQAAYAGYLIRFRTDEELIDAKFAYYFLRSSSYWANINSTLIQSTIQNFSAEKYGNIVVPLPPVKEQREIVHFIKEEQNKLDSFYNKANEVICKLEEYRTALITSAVTGKIDVREVNVPEGV